MAGKIYRRKKSGDFVTIDTHCLKNKDLKWDAKGLHSYLVQLPEDWQINISDLVNRSKDGRDATNSPMRALIDAGYVVRQMCFDAKGKFDGYDYFVFERPEHAEDWKTVNGKTVNGKTVNGKTVNGKTVNGKPATSKNEESKNELNKTTTEDEIAAAGAELIVKSTTEIEGVTLVEKVNVEAEKENPSPVPPPPSPPPARPTPGESAPRRWDVFDIDKAAAELKGNVFSAENFARITGTPAAQMIDRFEEEVDVFTLEQKGKKTPYNRFDEFSSHFFNYERAKVRAARNYCGPSNQRPAPIQKPNIDPPSQYRKLPRF